MKWRSKETTNAKVSTTCIQQKVQNQHTRINITEKSNVHKFIIEELLQLFMFAKTHSFKHGKLSNLLCHLNNNVLHSLKENQL